MLIISKGQFSLFLKKRKRFHTFTVSKYSKSLFYFKLPLFLFFIIKTCSSLFFFFKYSNNFLFLFKIPFCLFNNLFSYMISIRLLLLDLNFFYLCSSFLFLFNINSNIFFIKNYNKKIIQYSKAFNSLSTLTGYLYNLFFIIIRLPSLKLKIFFYLSTAFYMQSDFYLSNKRVTSTLAGMHNKLGFLPTVRGVAKNPVDHPHGGRTKSIKYPRTPWGLSTKKK